MSKTSISSHLELYTKKASPPESALKTILGGNLKGKTDINPQWRIDALTELYGLCGFGWYYKITDKREKTYADKIDMFVSIDLFVKVDGEWSQAIPGEGGNWYGQMANGKNDSKYPITNDEVYKMCVTDAISVAAKQLGIGGDIYAGSKYISIDEYGSLERGEQKPLTEKEKKETELKEKEAEAKKTDLVTKALAKVKEAKTLEELSTVWKENKTIQSVALFKDTTIAKRAELEKLTKTN